MQELTSILQAYLSRLTVWSVLDILLVSYLIYQVITQVRGRRGGPVVLGVAVVLVFYLVSYAFGLDLTRTILAYIVPFLGFALVVLFQSDIRRALARLGRQRYLLGGKLLQRETINEIGLALGKLSQKRIGALAVVEGDVGLKTFIESGVPLDARLSRDLLLSIFQQGGPLHDGAVIVRGDHIAAAACFLPLSLNPVLSRQLGTRHRAAIGITEESDCLAIVVSEETGRISIAFQGQLEQDVNIPKVEARLHLHARGVRRDWRPVADAALPSAPSQPREAT